MVLGGVGVSTVVCSWCGRLILSDRKPKGSVIQTHSWIPDQLETPPLLSTDTLQKADTTAF